MTWKGIRHTNPGEGIETLEEWMSAELHELAKGEELPGVGEEGDFYFNTADGHLYIWRNN